jgi:hypothetical protein
VEETINTLLDVSLYQLKYRLKLTQTYKKYTMPRKILKRTIKRMQPKKTFKKAGKIAIGIGAFTPVGRGLKAASVARKIAKARKIKRKPKNVVHGARPGSSHYKRLKRGGFDKRR